MTATGVTAAVVLHPHPGMGGDSRHPLVVAVADGLRAADVSVATPDLTDPDPERAAPALVAVADELVATAGAARLVLVGYSWGSVVSSLVAPPGLVARVLVAPPVGMTALGGDDGIPTLALVPSHDQFGGPVAAADALGDRAATTVEVVDGADHFLAGAVARVATRAVEWVLDRPV